MSISPQPANLPDYNANDLGFFASLQSLQHKKKAKTIENLVDNVDAAFKQLDFSTIDRVFVTMQSVLQVSMDVNGSNKYKIPHLFKRQIEKRNDLLPRSLPCSALVPMLGLSCKTGVPLRRSGDGDVATPTSSSLSLSFEEEEKGETPSVCDVEDVARGVQSALW
ncbi:hypothetical protein PPTG_19821 [Phytophthora nicotianae INRA-310]|uniref:Uncharacterized protein n=1 Tax=Phytophthora nicotianae (strain INRA-310) TaxID=761204 RepID=W2PDH0_PHYN3|nr:hypothetical protein PPTG_19821 [Phytophthora nicotianae INRA-310]ETM98069.1 hypothetical protein PPTG_19821 [Phytophthora nicotianae INRA-310]